MLELLSKENFTEDDIINLINNNLEESIHIEFKAAGSLSKEDAKKREIGKDISAFANSDGGLIFYGIEEINHTASKISLIDGHIFNKEWLENIIASHIQRPIPGLKIHPIRIDKKIEQTVYVVQIPKSVDSPHLCSDKRYYRRYNFKSVPMEEYEIRDAYLRYRDSNVDISDIHVKFSKDSEFYKFNVTIHAVNDSQFICENFKIACNFTNYWNVNLSSDRSYSHTDKGSDGYKISTNNALKIFPNEILNVMNLQINFPIDYFDIAISDLKIDFYVYSVTGFKVIENNNITQMMKNLVQKNTSAD